MLEALSGGARGDDDEVTAGEAVSYVRDGLRRVPGRVQTPQLSGVPGLVLARGVSDLPTSVEESASVLVGTSTRREVSAWSPYWLSLGAGLGSELQSERFTPVVSVRGGAHLGGGEESRYRLGAELMYVQSENPLYRQAVEALRELERATDTSFGRPSEGEEVHRILASLLLGGAWDVGPVLSADVSGGLNVAPDGRSVQWDSGSGDPSADYPCSKEESVAVGVVVCA